MVEQVGSLAAVRLEPQSFLEHSTQEKNAKQLISKASLKSLAVLGLFLLRRHCLILLPFELPKNEYAHCLLHLSKLKSAFNHHARPILLLSAQVERQLQQQQIVL